MRSRKYNLAILAITLIIATGLCTVVLPAFVPALDTVVGGIITIFAIYGGANIGNKWVMGNQKYPGVVERAERSETEDVPPDILKSEQEKDA